MKMRIVIGSLSDPNFAEYGPLRRIQEGSWKDRSRIRFGELLFQNIAQKKNKLFRLSRNYFPSYLTYNLSLTFTKTTWKM